MSTPIPQLQDAERLDLGGYTVYIASATHAKSEGYLELPPGKEMQRHHRPVEERLKQIEGESMVTVFGNDGEPVVHELLRGAELNIPAVTEHIHANPFGKNSITHWRFEGDIIDTLEEQRMLAKRLGEERGSE
ncbi:MAG: hypothetical protein WC659_03420 [Patescibacteria group bacterium]